MSTRYQGIIILMLLSVITRAQKPNIIFILADDLGYGSIGAFGQQKIKTPNLDKMANGGMKLTNFYANPICAPTRASFFTGLSSAHSVIRDNYELGGYEDSTEFGQMPLPSNITTLGTVLKSSGYTTAVFGKWGMGGPNSTGVPWKQGIDTFYGYLDQKQAHNYYPSHLWRNNIAEKLPNNVISAHQKLAPGKDPYDEASYSEFKGNVYSCDTITAEALKFIRTTNRSKPFFMYMAYTIPHMALQVPDKYLKQYIGKFDEKPVAGGGYLPVRYPYSTYAAMITLLDEYVGRIMQQLKESGLDKNTLIVFTGDNGAAGGGAASVNPDYFNCTPNFKGRKGSLYEGGIREPFIAYWPGKIKPGTSSDHISAIWDMLPTFSELAQTKAVNTDGISMVPVLLGKNNQQEHEYLYWETHRSGKGIQAVRYGAWKAVRRQTHVNPNNPVELYDLKNDISETTDVAAKHPEIMEKIYKYLNSREIAVLKEWNFYIEPNSADADKNN